MKFNKRLWTLAGICLLALAVVVVAADSTGRFSVSIPAGPAYPQRSFSSAALWDVVSVLGPDRILIRRGPKQQTVRLIGVSPARIESEQSSGVDDDSRTVEFLSNLLAGERVHVIASPRLGQGELPGRRIFRAPDGLYVNLEVVRQGYGTMSPVGLGGELKIFEVYQRRAQLSRKGRWSKRLPPVPARKVAREVSVYLTKTGEKYHKEDCTFLAKSKIAISLSQAKRRGFAPCKICRPGR